LNDKGGFPLRRRYLPVVALVSKGGAQQTQRRIQ
jgi:hypothetical protein